MSSVAVTVLTNVQRHSPSLCKPRICGLPPWNPDFCFSENNHESCHPNIRAPAWTVTQWEEQKRIGFGDLVQPVRFSSISLGTIKACVTQGWRGLGCQKGLLNMLENALEGSRYRSWGRQSFIVIATHLASLLGANWILRKATEEEVPLKAQPCQLHPCL